jgi:hypothetical protein
LLWPWQRLSSSQSASRRHNQRIQADTAEPRR